MLLSSLLVEDEKCNKIQHHGGLKEYIAEKIGENRIWETWRETHFFSTEPIEHFRKQFDILDGRLETTWPQIERSRKPDCGKNTDRKQKMSQ